MSDVTLSEATVRNIMNKLTEFSDLVAKQGLKAPYELNETNNLVRDLHKEMNQQLGPQSDEEIAELAATRIHPLFVKNDWMWETGGFRHVPDPLEIKAN